MEQVAQEENAALNHHMAARMAGARGPAEALEAYIRGTRAASSPRTAVR